MKRKLLILIFVLFGAALAALVFMQRNRIPNETESQTSAAKGRPSSDAASIHVPAHYEELQSLSSLEPTLSPEKFSGMTRDAYKAAKEIPQTLLQMPCYC